MKAKKSLSVLLAVLCLLCACAPAAGAMSIRAGYQELNKNFVSGTAANGFDYLYYSPVRDSSDTQKYPLMVWLHGMKSGTEPGSQLQWYGFSNWSSEEYQARFADAGGCFLFAPRACNPLNNWDAALAPTLKSMIDGFIAENADNIDTSRIYIGGYSTGGVMVWSMLTLYPGFFAAGLPAASITQPTAAELNAMDNTSVWIFCCDKDYYSEGASGAAMQTYRYLAAASSRRSGVRVTQFSEAVLANGNKKTEMLGDKSVIANDAEHYVWEAITYDMHMSDGVTPYLYTVTYDGNENTILFDDPEVGVIDWLSRQTNENITENEPANFFQKLLLLFRKLFGSFLALFKIRLY